MDTGSFKMEDMLAAIAKCEAQPMQTLMISRGLMRSMENAALNLEPTRTRNPIFDGYRTRTTFMGFGVEVAEIPPETVYDWSECRSPARAQRRHKMGKPQRVKVGTRDVAYLVDKKAIGRISDAWDRHAIKMLIG